MDDEHSFTSISPTTFDALLADYPTILPKKLEELDQQRYTSITNAIDQRGPAYLTKDELTALVDWKLSHGKFRPTLKSLVNQNSDDTIESTTMKGFAAYTGAADSIKPSLNTLAQLKGIGPATASLLLSVCNPEIAPFFSDELFRWSHFEGGKGQGWDREIKYTLKEYLELFERVQEFRSRWKDDYGREVASVEIEKVAYVLGKRGVGAVTSKEAETKNGSNVGKKRKGDDEVVAEKIEAGVSEPIQATTKIPRPSKAVKPIPSSQTPTAASTRPRRCRS